MKQSQVIRQTLTVTAGAYSAGNQLGQAQFIAGLGSGRDCGRLLNISVLDRGNQKPAITFLLFDGALTGTYTDKVNPTFSAADELQFLGKVDIATTDYITAGGVGFGTKQCTIAMHSHQDEAIATRADRTITIIAIVTGTPTPAGTTDYTIAYGFEHEN